MATVTELSGHAWVRQPDGTLLELLPGAAIPPDSEIITASGATVTLVPDGAAPITIGENRSVAITDDLITPADPAQAAVTPPGSADILPQTGEHAPATDPGASALALPDAMPRASGNAASPAPTPALPAIAAPLASPQWSRELGQRLVTLSQHGDGQTHSAELRLDPPELGPLRVTLTLTDGIAHAAFVSPHAHVRHSLEAALDHLHATLAQAGIELGQTSVSDQPAQHGHSSHAQPSLPPLRPATDTPPTTLAAAPPAPRSAGLVDAYV